MTEPTDAEIVSLMRDGNNCNYNDEAEHIDYARAVLAKWGQPAQAAESRTIPDREIPGIVERALQELEGLVKYATSTYGHWDMRRAKGALSDLEWWARRKLAAHAQAAEPVAWYEYNGDLDAWFLAYIRNPKAKTRPLVFGDTAPQPVERVPLTDEQIKDGHTGMPRDVWAFADGVRFAEQHHGIKGGQHGTE